MDPVLAWTIAGVVVAALPVGVSLRNRWKDGQPPHLSMAVDVSLNRAQFPTDRYTHGWGRSANLRYTVIRIKNKRGKAITVAGVFAAFPGLDYTACLAAANDLRVLQPEESTYVYFETTKYGGARPSAVNVHWLGGEHTYRRFHQLLGWEDS